MMIKAVEHEFPTLASARLYNDALRRQWDVEQVEWSELQLESLSLSLRTAMSAAYTYILYSERFGLRMLLRLVDSEPEAWLRDFIRTQIVDEARHVAFFERVVARLKVSVCAPIGLQDLAREVDATVNTLHMFVHCQVIENAAQLLFIETARQCRARMGTTLRLPGRAGVEALLDALLRYVARDEARHIAFGRQYIKWRVAGTSADERRDLSATALTSCKSFYSSFDELGSQILRLGLQPTELKAKLWHAESRAMSHFDLQIGREPLDAKIGPESSASVSRDMGRRLPSRDLSR